MIEGEINSENQQSVLPNSAVEEAALPQAKNNFSKKRIILYSLILLLILIFIAYMLIQESKTGSVPTNPKISPTTTITSAISPTVYISKSPSPTVVASPTAAFVPDQLIIKYKYGQTPEELTAQRDTEITIILDQAGVLSQEKLYSSQDSTLKRYYVLKFKKGTNLESAKETLSTIPEIENAEQNNIININD